MKLYNKTLLHYLKIFWKQRTLSFYLFNKEMQECSKNRMNIYFSYYLINTNYIWTAATCWLMKPHSFVTFFCNRGSLYLSLFSLNPIHKTYSSFLNHYIFFQSDIIFPIIHIFHDSSYFSIRAPGICLFSLFFMLPLISSLQALWVSKNQWYGCCNFF